MSLHLASYKGKGKIGNALIRWWKRSVYSHCEIVVDGICYSSSITDHGVRSKEIDLTDGKWDVDPILWAKEEDVLAYYKATKGQKYSWTSIIWSQFFSREIDEPFASFCSEWGAAALKLPNPQIMSPEALKKLNLFLNHLTATSR